MKYIHPNSNVIIAGKIRVYIKIIFLHQNKNI